LAADQQLYREPSPEAPAPPVPSEEFKEIVKPSKPKLSEQGLYFFSLIVFAPQYNNPVPFYFHTGLVYKGLIPGRDQDQLGVAFAYGNYSYYKQLADGPSRLTKGLWSLIIASS
jgi:porin